MAGRLENSWNLVKASGNVLAQDKELILFPLLSFIAAMVISISFFGPMLLLGNVEALAEGGGFTGTALMFLYYMVLYTVMFFFNAALVGAALLRLEGEDPTLADGFQIATSRIRTILGYAVIAATVGMVLKMISERAGIFGSLAAGLVGLGWNLATFMVVPVLITRDVDPVSAIRESAGLFKQTWGEQVAGNVGMGWAFGLLSFGVVIVSVLLMIVLGNIAPLLVLPVVVAMGFTLLILALVASALKGVYSAALYKYAVSGQVPSGFDARLFEQAFTEKKKRSWVW